MTPHAIEAAAAALADARRAGKLLEALPADIRPATIEDGYRVQDAFRRQWGGIVLGWKIGATAMPIMDKFALTEPFAAPFFAADTEHSPAWPKAADHPHLCIEAEIAFRFAKPLPPREAPYSRAEVLEAVGAVLPAFELIGPRFDRVLFDAVPTVIGDCGLNAAMVLGTELAEWHRLDLVHLPVRVSVSGGVRWEGSGAAVMGDPVTVIEWTANHLSRRGITLQAGDVVSTGATTGLMFPEVDEVVVADFGPLGQIEMAFAGPRSTAKVLRG